MMKVYRASAGIDVSYPRNTGWKDLSYPREELTVTEIKQMYDQFDRRGHSFEQMKVIATDQPSLFDFDDESLPCFCGD